MSSQSETTLPEKCCARCGFLYGVCTLNMLNPEDRHFDPDLLRTDTSTLSGEFEYNTKVSSHTHSTKKGSIEGYTLQGLKSLNCFYSVFQYLETELNSRNKEEVKNNIAKIYIDRTKTNPPCPHFFPYHPGFSAKGHAEIRLQEQRDAQQQAFQDRWNTLVFEAEENARTREERWRQLEAEHRKQNNVITAANLILAFILGGVLVAEFIIKFILPPK